MGDQYHHDRPLPCDSHSNTDGYTERYTYSYSTAYTYSYPDADTYSDTGLRGHVHKRGADRYP